ncbi:MAG: TonB-dependent receptor [Bacteroidia bacterium]
MKKVLILLFNKMNLSLYRFTVTLMLLMGFLPFSLLAQSPSFEIKGVVLNGTNSNPIEFASVMLVDATNETKLTGTTTEADGSFSLQASQEEVYVEISFIGYETLVIRELPLSDGTVNLGAIRLVEQVVSLDQVLIEGEKSSTEFKLDKRVFNVGKDLSSTGASALEVLNNVPSVNVSIEGSISLRGSSGVQILINGKPSVIASEEGNALGTITADMIEKIEVITNPSAKYEAEGTSGIINIVLKKEEREGLNGAVSLNTGWPHNHSLGLSLNRRTEKFNLFSQLGVGYRELPNESENINQNLLTNSQILSKGTEYRNETFYNIVLGTDYHINKYNVLTLSGNFAYEVEDQPSATSFTQLDSNGQEISRWNREETTQATNPKYQYELQYKKDFRDNKDHNLLFSALGNFFGKDQSSIFTNNATLGEIPFGNQQTRTNFQEARYTFKLDYTKPIKEVFTLETGAQYFINDVSNDFEVNEWVNNEWLNDASLTNVFEYGQKVLGVYSTGAYEGNKWGLKLGLRLENTEINTLLVNTNEVNNQTFTNWFPSVHSSYKITDAFSLQAGYSRRIFRPRLWDLNPFFNVRNNFSVRTGNPNLQPEFTDSYEVNSIYIFEKASFNFGVFHRYTTDVVERISIFEEDVNITKPLNIGTNRATGLEFNGKYSPERWFSINGDFNYLYFNRMGSFDATSFDFVGNQWSTKLTTKFKLPADIDFEVTGQYQSKFLTVQSEISDQLFADFGVRKKIMNGKAVLNLSVRDVFASRVRESNTFQPDFYLYSRRQRGRFIAFGFSYGFGKGEAMEYSGNRRHH